MVVPVVDIKDVNAVGLETVQATFDADTQGLGVVTSSVGSDFPAGKSATVTQRVLSSDHWIYQQEKLVDHQETAYPSGLARRAFSSSHRPTVQTVHLDIGWQYQKSCLAAHISSPECLR